MAGGAGTHVLVRRIRPRAATVSGYDLLDAAEVFEDRFEAPEAAAAERCLLACDRGRAGGFAVHVISRLAGSHAGIHIISPAGTANKAQQEYRPSEGGNGM